MVQFNLHFEFIPQIPRKRISRIYATMLAAGATEIYR